MTAQCDAIDGTKDGIVQDPTRCPVHAEDLLCKHGENQACINADQEAVLIRYTDGLRDKKGHVVYPGWALTDHNHVALKKGSDLRDGRGSGGADVRSDHRLPSKRYCECLRLNLCEADPGSCDYQGKK